MTGAAAVDAGGQGTTPPPPPPATVVSVTGGVGGLTASYQDAGRLAECFDEAGDRLRTWALHSREVLKDPDLLESGLVSPATCARAEGAVLATLVALEADSLHWELDARAVRAAIDLLVTTDAAVRVAVDSVDYRVDAVLGFGLVRAAPVTTLPIVGAAMGGVLDDRLLTDHPTAFTHLMNGSGGLLDGMAAGLGFPLFTPTVEDGARVTVTAYGDEGHPVVRRLDPGQHPRVGGDRRQPASVQDLVDHLGEVAGLSAEPDSELNGTISVQTLTGVDGGVRHIVYLPGTDDLTTTPLSQDGDVRDMATNLQLMAGQEDTYQRGILQALQQAGVEPGQPVAVVGHSQGGMEAAALLAHHAGPGGVHITDVVTAGSPTAQVGSFPAGSHVLSIEQHGDIVPLLDGRAPVDSVPQTTVVVDAHPDGGVLAHHSYPTYSADAAAVDASTDPSVRADLSSLHAHGFLGDGAGVRVTTQMFQITRG